MGKRGERGVARSEVVDGDADTAIVQRPEKLDGREEIDGRRLCDLHGEDGRAKVALLQLREDPGGEIGDGERGGREVHRHGDVEPGPTRPGRRALRA